jgi:hypothetical protein
LVVAIDVPEPHRAGPKRIRHHRDKVTRIKGITFLERRRGRRIDDYLFDCVRIPRCEAEYY